MVVQQGKSPGQRTSRGVATAPPPAGHSMGELAAQVLGAVLLGGTAGIHARLYTTGYSTIPKIGPLFLVNAVAGSLLCLAMVLVRGRWGWLPAGVGVGLELGTLVGLIVAVTRGIFGFTDTTAAPLFWQSIVVEGAGTLVLGALTALGARRWFLSRE